jgi:starch phosphorylase
MSGQFCPSHPAYGFLPTEIEGLDFLAEPALDLRWSWIPLEVVKILWQR